MVQRSIVLFPRFSNGNRIDVIRERFDPLARKIGPHITLVFPFECDVDADILRRHVAKVVGRQRPFRVAFGGITLEEEGYLFLRCVAGGAEICRLHDWLYGRILERFLRVDLPYVPHITVGRVADAGLRTAAWEAVRGEDALFETRVEEVVVERVLEDGTSSVEFAVGFRR